MSRPSKENQEAANLPAARSGDGGAISGYRWRWHTKLSGSDDDGDGVLSEVELANGDTDGDGIRNYLDMDDDGDGIPSKSDNEGLDPTERNLNDDDTDGDGIPNYLDIDDDGDGVKTIDEDLQR
ncbi:MAG: hypothetical protein R2932_43970 [Caldilineaceae bacterium]